MFNFLFRLATEMWGSNNLLTISLHSTKERVVLRGHRLFNAKTKAYKYNPTASKKKTLLCDETMKKIVWITPSSDVVILLWAYMSDEIEIRPWYWKINNAEVNSVCTLSIKYEIEGSWTNVNIILQNENVGMFALSMITLNSTRLHAHIISLSTRRKRIKQKATLGKTNRPTTITLKCLFSLNQWWYNKKLEANKQIFVTNAWPIDK